MPLLWRFWRTKQHNPDLEEEIAFDLAAETEERIQSGASRSEAETASHRDFGNIPLIREDVRQTWGSAIPERLAQDVRYGWRQLNKHRAVSAAAILSLALAVGACAVSFRLIDALMLRTLPIAQPDRFFYLANTFIDRDGRPDYNDDFDYPTFRRYREALAGHAELMLIGMTSRQEADFGTTGVTEKFYRQYLSGNVFAAFGLTPSLGRLLAPDDDLAPGSRAVAVLSHDFWTRRFAADPTVVGKTFRYAGSLYEIVGVAPQGFIGTEPGLVTDVFIPSMMNAGAINSPGWSWFRTWVRPNPGVAPDQVRERLQALLTTEHREHVRHLAPETPRAQIEAYLKESILLRPAASGASAAQKQYQRPLLILSCLVALVLLIACANVGNLTAAQSASRAREMALRVSIGAGKGRLIQMVLVESLMLALISAAAGVLFSKWAARFVVSMLAPPEDPMRLVLGDESRILALGLVLAIVIALSFGLAPALRASSVKPANALKGGEDPHARRGLMNSLIVGQMALCVLVLFIAGLFVSTFGKLVHQPLGFAADRIVAVEAMAANKNEPIEAWLATARRLRQMPGVDAVGFAGWTFLSGNNWRRIAVIPNRATPPLPPYCLDVSPGFFDAMGIGFLGGRDFRLGDRGVGIVNEAFARKYFDGRNPVGQVFYTHEGKNVLTPMDIVGYVRSSTYSNVREPFRPIIYVPIEKREGGTLIVRTSADPALLAPALRSAIPHVRNIDIQSALVRRQMIRERLLATLSGFFGLMALVLAAVGLYGVLNYSVIQQRKEIGIRMALGAPAGHVVHRVATGMFSMVSLGLLLGLAGGLASVRFIETLLFEVRATDLGSIAGPLLILLTAAATAAAPPVIRAIRIDPAQTLRNE